MEELGEVDRLRECGEQETDAWRPAAVKAPAMQTASKHQQLQFLQLHLNQYPHILQLCWQTSHFSFLQSRVQPPRHHMSQNQAKSFLRAPSKIAVADVLPVPHSRTLLHSASLEHLPLKFRRSWVLVRLILH